MCTASCLKLAKQLFAGRNVELAAAGGSAAAAKKQVWRIWVSWYAGRYAQIDRSTTRTFHHSPNLRFNMMESARQANKRIVLPEGAEPRTVHAAAICHEKGRLLYY